MIGSHNTGMSEIQHKRLVVRYVRHWENYLGLVHMACAICVKEGFGMTPSVARDEVIYG